MRRRGFMKLAGAGALGGGAVFVVENGGPGSAGETVADQLPSGVAGASDDDESLQNDDMVQSFGFGSPGFEEIEFRQAVGETSGYVATITWESHSMDGFGIRHQSHDSPDDDLVKCGAPVSTGSVTVDLIGEIRSAGAVYPNRRFSLVAYDGSYTECGKSGPDVTMDTRGTAGFTLPESIAPASAFQDM